MNGLEYFGEKNTVVHSPETAIPMLESALKNYGIDIYLYDLLRISGGKHEIHSLIGITLNKLIQSQDVVAILFEMEIRSGYWSI